MDVDAIVNAVRGVLTGTVGSIRTIPAGKFLEEVHDNSTDAERWLKGRGGTAGALQAQADVRTLSPRRTGMIGNPDASLNIWLLPVEVVLHYAALPYAGVVPARRYDNIRNQAASDVVDVTKALTFSGNLLQDVDANATEIVSGLLHPRGEPRIEREDFGDTVGLFAHVLPFDAWIKETQAVA